MELRPGYTQTEVGVIPDDWKLISFDKAFDFLSTASYSRAQLSDNEKVDYVHYGDIHTKWNHFLNFLQNPLPSISETQLKKNYNLIKEGDLIMVDASEDYEGIGKSVEVKNIGLNKAISGLHTYLLRDKNGVFVNGFKGYIYSNKLVKKQFDRLATGLKVYGVSKNNLKVIQIPLPPKAEQEAIAEALNDVDALISSLDKLITKKRNIKQGAMQQLLTGKKRLPGFTDEWVDKSLGDIAIITMGQSPSSSFYNNSGIGLPLIQGNADIKNRKTIIRNYTSQITKRCFKGDIILSVRAPVGEVAIAVFDACVGRGVCAISYPSNFLYHYLIFIEPQWGKLSKGSTFDSVNSNEVKALEIKLPDNFEEQKAIAKILSDMDAEIAALEARRDKTKAIKQGMMQVLLTGRIRLL